MDRTRLIFTRDFKIETVNQLLAGKPIGQVARENDLHPTLITRWKRGYADNPEKAFSGHGNAYKDTARIAELERLVGQLYAEVEFFKKKSQKPWRKKPGGEKENDTTEIFTMIKEVTEAPIPVPVKHASSLLNVSRSGYYKWTSHDDKQSPDEEEQLLKKEIHKIVGEFTGYGYR